MRYGLRVSPWMVPQLICIGEVEGGGGSKVGTSECCGGLQVIVAYECYAIVGVSKVFYYS